VKYSFNYSLPTKNRAKRLAWIAGLCLIIAGLIGWLATDRWYKANLAPLSQDSKVQIVFIQPDSSTLQVADQLEDSQIIRNSRAFAWYISRLDGDPLIQAGTYRLDSAQSVPDIAAKLINGDIDNTLITIPPGLRLAELEEVILAAGYDQADIDAALKAKYTSPVLADKPGSATLEGYIFPETFQIDGNSTPKSIIQRSLDEFSERLTPAIRQGITRQDLNLHQAIILASIIQLEDPRPDNQRKIAQVFLSRLAQDMPLGADPTFKYAAAIMGVEESVDLDSPYNTRIHAGLPPGPIANFNLSALKAVASPAGTDWLYFVHGDDCLDESSDTCTLYFAHTAEEHEANRVKYCRQYCQL